MLCVTHCLASFCKTSFLRVLYLMELSGQMAPMPNERVLHLRFMFPLKLTKLQWQILFPDWGNTVKKVANWHIFPFFKPHTNFEAAGKKQNDISGENEVSGFVCIAFLLSGSSLKSTTFCCEQKGITSQGSLARAELHANCFHFKLYTLWKLRRSYQGVWGLFHLKGINLMARFIHLPMQKHLGRKTQFCLPQYM